MPGDSGPIIRIIRPICARSDRSAAPAPGYWILTATGRPSRQTPGAPDRSTRRLRGCRRTPGSVPASAGRSARPGPRERGRQAAPVRRPAAWPSEARYGAASSSGMAASKTDIAWPTFIAPPLSSPRTRNMCSAVRSWTSAATASAGLPPTRLPTPRAVRPANPKGSAASLARTGHRAAGEVGHLAIVGDWPDSGHAQPHSGCWTSRRTVRRAVRGARPRRSHRSTVGVLPMSQSST